MRRGKVEGLTGTARRNFLVPIPRLESFEALNAHLEARCRERQGAKLRGHEATIAERMARDRAAFLPLPPAPSDACGKRPGRASSLSLVRYKGNDYSVPMAYGHRAVLVRGYVERVVIGCAAEAIARPKRSYEREDPVFDPLHDPPLIERKVGALDQAALSLPNIRSGSNSGADHRGEGRIGSGHLVGSLEGVECLYLGTSACGCRCSSWHKPRARGADAPRQK